MRARPPTLTAPLLGADALRRSLGPLALIAAGSLGCNTGSWEEGGLPPAGDDDLTAHDDDGTGDDTVPDDDGDDDTAPPDDADGDGYSPAEGDCDDSDPDVHPGAEETWDGIDSDCNGTDYDDPCASPPPVVPIATDDTCQFEPPTGAWNPVVEWHSESFPTAPEYNQVMASPVVGNLSDDNGDGIIGLGDVPDVAFTTFTGSAYTSGGYLRVWNGDGGGERWASPGFSGAQVHSSATPAIGDVDGDGSPEVVVPTTDTRLLVFGADGTAELLTAVGSTGSWGAVALADFEGDGQAEMVLGRTVWNADGSVRWNGTQGSGAGFSFPMDLDGDGTVEVVAGNSVYREDGSTLWVNASAVDGFPAAGDFNGDGVVDVVAAYGSVHVLSGVDGSFLWQVSMPGSGGGPPTVADYDGDGAPEVGVAGATVYAVFETDGSVRWTRTVQDYSSAVTGSSVFDFDGDGAAEVVYGDEVTLWVFAGATGDVLLQINEHASGTLYEYPVLADVDRDGAVEIVLTSNNYAFDGWTGVTVIGSADDRWVSGRPIWNQHAWSITNVADDGSLPGGAPANVGDFNSFRQGGYGSFDPIGAPNLRVEILGPCAIDCAADTAEMLVRIHNNGLSDVGTGIPLSAWGTAAAGNTWIGTWALPWGIASGTASEAFSVPLDVAQGPFEGILFAVDDNGSGVGVENECDETDNTAWTPGWPCDGS